MQEQLISFETALLAKKIGFDIPTIYGYIEGELKSWFTYQSYSPGEPVVNINDFIREWEVQCPTQSLLQKWLREVHDIVVNPTPRTLLKSSNGARNGQLIEDDKIITNINNSKEKSFKVIIFEKGVKVSESFSGRGYTYEEALELGLRQALELLKINIDFQNLMIENMNQDADDYNGELLNWNQDD